MQQLLCFCSARKNILCLNDLQALWAVSFNEFRCLDTYFCFSVEDILSLTRKGKKNKKRILRHEEFARVRLNYLYTFLSDRVLRSPCHTDQQNWLDLGLDRPAPKAPRKALPLFPVPLGQEAAGFNRVPALVPSQPFSQIRRAGGPWVRQAQGPDVIGIGLWNQALQPKLSPHSFIL